MGLFLSATPLTLEQGPRGQVHEPQAVMIERHKVAGLTIALALRRAISFMKSSVIEDARSDKVYSIRKRPRGVFFKRRAP